MYSESATRALQILRDPSQFQWYVIPFFAVVVYVYAVEVEKRNWAAVCAGLAYWGMDWFNEIWNSIIFRVSDFAPAWGAPGDTAFLILIGLNIEISFMFAMAGLAFTKLLPKDKNQKLLGLPNRLVHAVVGAAFCVFIEVLLNKAGALTWDYSWWNIAAPWLIFLFGYLPFFLVSFWVFDMKSNKSRLKVLGVIYGVDLVGLAVFGLGLGWL